MRTAVLEQCNRFSVITKRLWCYGFPPPPSLTDLRRTRIWNDQGQIIKTHHVIWAIYRTCSRTRTVTQLFEQNEDSRKGNEMDVDLLVLWCYFRTPESHLPSESSVSSVYSKNLYSWVPVCGPISCETVGKETKEGTYYHEKLEASHRFETEWEMGHIHIYYLN